jgi:hypothetical protein
MLRGFQAEDAAEKAFLLETKGEAADMAGSGALTEELAGEIKRLEEQLRLAIDRHEANERSDS